MNIAIEENMFLTISYFFV